MKKYKILVAAIFLCFNISYSQSGWVWQNPTPYLGKTFYTSYFINSNTGWAAGESVISKTTNGGINWVDQLSGDIYVSIYFLNSMTGYAGGEAGTLKITTDGGTVWTERILPGATSISSVYFKDASTGFVGVLTGQIYRTTNSGLNWQIQTYDNAGGFMDFKFFNANDGIVLASPVGISFSSSYDAKFYKTTNGGLNWVLGNFPPSVYTSKSFFIDNNTGWSFYNYTISKTTNGGLNWVQQLNTANNKYIYSISFANSQTGYACGWDGTLYKTSNGGTNWNLQDVPSDWDLYTVENTDASTCYAIGETGNIFKTSNSGNNWSSYLRFQHHDEMYDIQAITPSTIYAVGRYQEGHFHVSSNGGVLWDTLHIPPPMASAHSLSFVNAQTGWIAGGYNLVMKTTNAGLSWENKFVPEEPNIDVSHVKFLDTQTGWAIASRYIYKTTNGGNNWVEKLNFQFDDDYIQCCFINAQTGWVVGNYYGYILKTTNGGNSWAAQDSNTTGAESVYFLNAQTGWVGTESCVKKTTSGGASWDSLSAPYGYVNKIWFADVMTGWHIGGGTALFKTTNSGYNWDLQFTLPAYGLRSMAFLNANTGWICGSTGSILKTTTGGNVFISQTSTEIPQKYSLYQNYPNPFNPSTNIKFDMQKQGIATLKVFDLLGKEIETLVDEQLSAGTYEVAFNASSLPSGIYFYVLKTGDFVESKKMVLVK